VHALALAKPTGWKLAAQKGATWLESQQSAMGCWHIRGCSAVMLTVLSLDAIALARGTEVVTFSRAWESGAKPEVSAELADLLPVAHTAGVISAYANTRELDNESKDRVLVGEVTSIVAAAGQISREHTVSDWGIDMEIEFKNDQGQASAKKLYLQLKSGDSHLRRRQSDGAEIFTIRETRHAEYWAAHAFPVMLVIRDSAGAVRWMEIRDLLKRLLQEGAPPTQLEFKGEPFDVVSVERWRVRTLKHE
jgi:hypothetical protein